MGRVLYVMLCLLLPWGAVVVPAQAATEKGVALKADKLVAEPFADAKQVGKLSKGDEVTILKKAGGWYQVKAASAQGWVRMLSVRRGQAGKSNTAKDVAGLATGRAGTGQIVSTTGVRGLSEEELKQAKYDAAELKQAEAFAVSKADAAMFAQKAQLAARPFNYLPAN